MNIKEVIGKEFQSERIASTDIHNAGSIFGYVFRQVIEFHDNGRLTMINKLEKNKGALSDWKEYRENEKWEGTYTFDSDDKHVKCSLLKTGSTNKKTIYADFVDKDILICEMYENGSDYPKGGLIFEGIKKSS